MCEEAGASVAGGSTGVALHTVERVMALPVVSAAVSQATHVYSAVKEVHPLVSWALGTAEHTVARAATAGAPLVAPLVAGPLNAVDARMVAGLDKLETSLPLVKEQPHVIYGTARDMLSRKLQPPLQQVCSVKNKATRAAVSLRELSWRAANDVLATHGGRAAVGQLDGGVALAHSLLDYYLPPQDADMPYERAGVVDAREDPALHTVQSVARLSYAAAWRVHAAVARRVADLHRRHKPTVDPARYVAALVAVLHLTRLLQPELDTPAPSSTHIIIT